MSPSVICLLGLIGWTIVLLFVLLGARTKPAIGGQLIFDQQGGDLPGLGARITRAQGNSLEWLTIPAALLVLAIATGQTHVTDGLALVVLGARVLQSLVHIMSVSLPAIIVRASLFTAQVVIWILWMVGLAGGM